MARVRPLVAPEVGSCASPAAPGGSGRLETPRARGRATGRPATASGARASRFQSLRLHRPLTTQARCCCGTCG
eukprot:scaffold34071_cov48-Phaeocystis_antarctica.AAC.3